MFVLGGLTAIGLAAVRVPYWLTFGVFSGAAALVPVFGVLLATVLPALFVLGSGGGLSKALLVIGVGVVVHVIDGNVVSPLVMSRRVAAAGGDDAGGADRRRAARTSGARGRGAAAGVDHGRGAAS